MTVPPYCCDVVCVYVGQLRRSYPNFRPGFPKKLQLPFSSPLQRTGLSDGNVKRQKHSKYSVHLTDTYIFLSRDFFQVQYDVLLLHTGGELTVVKYITEPLIKRPELSF